LKGDIKDGPVKAKGIKNEAGEPGNSERNLKKARDALGIEVVRTPEYGSPWGDYWQWQRTSV